MSGRRLQEWERQAVLDAYRNGEKLEAIAAEFKCSGAAISQLAKRAGLPRRYGLRRYWEKSVNAPRQ